MSTTPIRGTLEGERVLALSPGDADAAASTWLRRPHVFAGRALTAGALAQWQAWQAGRLAHRGQDWIPGVVEGLEVQALDEAGATGFAATRLHIAPGRGLAASGEDVVLQRPLDALLADVPVVAPAGFFANGSGVEPGTEGEAPTLRPRGIGAALGALAPASLATLPAIGVLVLQPVQADATPFDAMDPCERSACDEGSVDDAAAFTDWRVADAARLLWFVWPGEWRGIPAVADAQRRNALAWTVFDAAAALAPGETLPWDDWGVPIALVALDADRKPQWLDRASVVRQGGTARDARLGAARLQGKLRLLDADSRLPALWQARIEQFAEQIASAGEPAPAADQLADVFGRFMPPVGLLPKNAYDPAAHKSGFFPTGFDVDAAPVPLEQLDVAVRASAALAPLNLAAPESVRILVPVPLASWEPRLLHTERIDALFQQTLDENLLRRARTLGLRQGLRNQQALLAHAVDGQQHAVAAFKDDAAAVESESLSPWGPPPSGGGHRGALAGGFHEHLFQGATATFTPQAGERLFAWVCLDPDHPPRAVLLRWHAADGWEHAAWWGEDLFRLAGAVGTAGRWRGGALPVAGRWVRLEVAAARLSLEGQALDGMDFAVFDGRAAWGLAGAQGSRGPWRKWFCNVLPAGAKVQGNEAWDFLTGNDLWLPFEPRGGVVPSLPQPQAATATAGLPGAAAPADTAATLAVPASGFNLVYPEAAGWRGHTLIEPNLAPMAVIDKGAADQLVAWVYLDELSPPRALWAYVVTRSLRADGTPSGGALGLKLAFWGENHLSELAKAVPGIEAMNAQTERGGALPRAGTWTPLALRLPDSSKLAEGGVKMGVVGVVFMAFGGNLAWSDLTRVPAAAAQAPERVWPQQVNGLDTLPPWKAYLNSRVVAQNNLGVLTPTPSSRIGTVRAVADLHSDPLLARLSAHEQSQLQLRGLAGFADYLRARIDRADDITDFGFAHMQVDMYRIRQMTMNTADVSRLAISPTLAAIAKSDSALAVQSQIKDYIASVKATAQTRDLPDNTLATATRANFAALASTSLNTVSVSTTALSNPAFGNSAALTSTALGSSSALSGASVASASLANASLASAAALAGTQTGASAALRSNAAALAAIDTGARLIAQPKAPIGTVYANPVVGLSEVRTTAIAERLRHPPSTEARDYALANRQRTVASLVDLLEAFVAEDSGEVPALFADFPVPGLVNDPFLKGASGATRQLVEFRASANAGLLALLGKPPTLTNDPADTAVPLVDESTLFNQSISLSDITIATLRQLEARLTIYRDALTRCEAALDALRGDVSATAVRLAAVEDALGEARHDVGVARALMDEELQRIADINARRTRVLAEEVQFLAYIRPREVDTLLATPTHAVDPGLEEAPVPACLRDHPDPPDGLVDMLRVVREAPADWFVALPPVVARLDRVEHLTRLVQGAQVRAQASLAFPSLATPVLSSAQAGKLAAGIARVASRQAEAVAPRLVALRALDLPSLASATWQNIRAQAQQVVSFGDLADGGHGRADVAKEAAQELDGIRAVASCLHAGFSGVLPLLRLQWAETLSEFDAAPSLRNLAGLARWSEVPVEDRRRMQGLVDWLFGRIEPGKPQAVALVNDVVRMCLLLASHAPVDRIVHGRMARPVTGVSPGLRVPLAVLDVAALRVGMQAVLVRNDKIVARALVEDLGQGEVSARVLHTASDKVDLGDDVRVHFDNAAVVSLASASAKRTLFR